MSIQTGLKVTSIMRISINFPEKCVMRTSEYREVLLKRVIRVFEPVLILEAENNFWDFWVCCVLNHGCRDMGMDPCYPPEIPRNIRVSQP